MSLKRIDEILQAEELVVAWTPPSSTSNTILTIQGDFEYSEGASKATVEAIRDTLDNSHQKPFALRNIKIEVLRGSLVCIVGTSGSGKSSLLKAILRELKATTGTIQAPPTVSYCAQVPWIPSCLFRDIILWGDVMRAEIFAQTLTACALDKDVATFADGIETEVGGKFSSNICTS